MGNVVNDAQVLWDNDGKRLATCGVDGSIRIWAVRNGMLLRSFIGHEKEVRTVIFDGFNFGHFFL